MAHVDEFPKDVYKRQVVHYAKNYNDTALQINTLLTNFKFAEVPYFHSLQSPLNLVNKTRCV